MSELGSEIARKNNSNLPGEHSKCVHIAGFRGWDDGFVEFVGADQLWSATAVETHDVSV
jgi:hypothetical protein